jgi:hypothetical protein
LENDGAVVNQVGKELYVSPGKLVRRQASSAYHTPAAAATEVTKLDRADADAVVLDELDSQIETRRDHKWSDAMPKLTVHVLTWKRSSSLRPLLKSLQQADYEGDKVDLVIHLDGGFSRDTLQVAEKQLWAFGEKRLVKKTENGGLERSWFSATEPQGEHDRALILEDDLEVSPQFYRWLKTAWSKYGPGSASELPDLAGISLERQMNVPEKPARSMHIDNNFEPYLYKLVGSHGFSPHPHHWGKFLSWVQSSFQKVDVSVPGLVTTDWWNQGGRKGMWTQYFIWWCEKEKLFTLYPSLTGEKTLVAHWAEKGLHSDGSSHGPDAQLALTTSEVPLDNFPKVPPRYGWDAELVDDDGKGWFERIVDRA